MKPFKGFFCFCRHFLIILLVSLNEETRTLIEEATNAMGCLLWGIESASNGKNRLLRIYIDKVNAEVDVDDCANVSRQLDLMFEVQNTTPREYTLEVSSPGLDRKFFSLEQMQPYLKKKLVVKLYMAIAGQKRFKGVLNQVNVDKASLELKVQNELIVIPFASVQQARLQIDL